MPTQIENNPLPHDSLEPTNPKSKVFGALLRPPIYVKHAYVDITGDFTAGVVLSEICYWLSENREELLKKGGKAYLTRNYNAWWHSCRLTRKQFERASRILKKEGLITLEKFTLEGTPTYHISLNIDALNHALLSLVKSE